jgi:hypothetical protein
MPNAYHAGFNTGYNCAEAVNFAPCNWMPYGGDIVRKYRAQKKPVTVSYDQMLVALLLAAKAVAHAHGLGGGDEDLGGAERADSDAGGQAVKKEEAAVAKGKAVSSSRGGAGAGSGGSSRQLARTRRRRSSSSSRHEGSSDEAEEQEELKPEGVQGRTRAGTRGTPAAKTPAKSPAKVKAEAAAAAVDLMPECPSDSSSSDSGSDSDSSSSSGSDSDRDVEMEVDGGSAAAAGDDDGWLKRWSDGIRKRDAPKLSILHAIGELAVRVEEEQLRQAVAKHWGVQQVRGC